MYAMQETCLKKNAEENERLCVRTVVYSVVFFKKQAITFNYILYELTYIRFSEYTSIAAQ